MNPCISASKNALYFSLFVPLSYCLSSLLCQNIPSSPPLRSDFVYSFHFYSSIYYGIHESQIYFILDLLFICPKTDKEALSKRQRHLFHIFNSVVLFRPKHRLPLHNIHLASGCLYT
jgi:hypothetical protein